MTTLKQFQEEGEKEFDSMFIVGNVKFSGLNNNKLTPQSLKLFLSQQTSLAYELAKKEVEQDFRKILNSGRKMYDLGKKEMLEIVIGEMESNPNEDGSESPNIHHWIERKQIQLRKLLALNEE